MIIFTDGAAKGNPGPGGWGAIVATKDAVVELGGLEEHTTNNRMELQALVAALQSAGGMAEEKEKIDVFSDSKYCIQGITKWRFGWEKNGWLTQAKQPVINKDLWQELIIAVEGLLIDWIYVAGHAGTPGNERVDEIASSCASNQSVDLYKGERATYSIDLVAPIETREASKSSKSRKGKAYSYVSMIDNDIQTHATWSECELRVKGKPARFKKALTEAEEVAIISEFKLH